MLYAFVCVVCTLRRVMYECFSFLYNMAVLLPLISKKIEKEREEGEGGGACVVGCGRRVRCGGWIRDTGGEWDVERKRGMPCGHVGQAPIRFACGVD